MGSIRTCGYSGVDSAGPELLSYVGDSCLCRRSVCLRLRVRVHLRVRVCPHLGPYETNERDACFKTEGSEAQDSHRLMHNSHGRRGDPGRSRVAKSSCLWLPPAEPRRCAHLPACQGRASRRTCSSRTVPYRTCIAPHFFPLPWRGVPGGAFVPSMQVAREQSLAATSCVAGDTIGNRGCHHPCVPVSLTSILVRSEATRLACECARLTD